MKSARKRACLILHKKSCMRPEVKQAIKEIRKEVDLTVRIPWGQRDLKQFIDSAIKDGETRIIAGGGDGTLNDVVNCLMKKKRAKKVSLGILPLGTANDFARGAGLPRDDLPAALKHAATGPQTRIDVGEVNGRYFVNVASGGFGAEITATTPKQLKKSLGGTAYTLVGLARLAELKPPYRTQITGDHNLNEECSLLVMAVGNNRYAGGGFEVAPKADLNDGLLDIAVIASAENFNLREASAEFADPFNNQNRFIRYHQAARFTIKTDRLLHINLDGEPMIDTEFAFTTHPSALSVVIGIQGGH